MITKMNKAHKYYNACELCKLLKLPRSSYCYQAKVSNKPISDTTKSIIKSMKQISLETGYTYGRRRLQRQLNNEGHQIGIHRTVTINEARANIKTYQGWRYLASVLDLASRQVVGWSLSKRANTQLTQDAMDNAIVRYKPNTDKLMFHSDQGTQYSSKAFIEYCSAKA